MHPKSQAPCHNYGSNPKNPHRKFFIFNNNNKKASKLCLLAKLIIINSPQSTKKKVEKLQQQQRTNSSVQQTPIMECSKTSKTSKRALCILHPTAKKKTPKTKTGNRKKTYTKHQSTPFGLLLLLLLLPTALDDPPTTKAQNMAAASAPHCF